MDGKGEKGEIFTLANAINLIEMEERFQSNRRQEDATTWSFLSFPFFLSGYFFLLSVSTSPDSFYTHQVAAHACVLAVWHSFSWHTHFRSGICNVVYREAQLAAI